MRAVDTNILARYYLHDDPAQAQCAARILAAGDVFVPKTVMLELEWVLRAVAEQPAGKVADCLAHLIALPGVTIEDHDEVEDALRHCRRGVDFADALHLAASQAFEILSPPKYHQLNRSRLKYHLTVWNCLD